MKQSELPQLDSGAADALKWITAQEFKSRTDYELRTMELNALIKRQQAATPADDGTDFGDLVRSAQSNLDFAAENVQRWQKSLLSFEKGVPQDKRDASEKITQAEGEQLLKALAIYERAATESLITSLCQEVLTCKTPEEVYKLASDKLRECKVNAIASAIREAHLPLWCKTAIEEVL